MVLSVLAVMSGGDGLARAASITLNFPSQNSISTVGTVPGPLGAGGGGVHLGPLQLDLEKKEKQLCVPSTKQINP